MVGVWRERLCEDVLTDGSAYSPGVCPSGTFRCGVMDAWREAYIKLLQAGQVHAKRPQPMATALSSLRLPLAFNAVLLGSIAMISGGVQKSLVG